LLLKIHSNSEAIQDYLNMEKTSRSYSGEVIFQLSRVTESSATHDRKSGDGSDETINKQLECSPTPTIVIIASGEQGLSSLSLQGEKSVEDTTLNLTLDRPVLRSSLLVLEQGEHCTVVRSRTRSLPVSAFGEKRTLSGIFESLEDRSNIAIRAPSHSSRSSSSRIDFILEDYFSPLAEFLDEDIPDPDAMQCRSFYEDALSRSESQRSESKRSRMSVNSANSLPMHPDFKTPAFRTVPNWLKVKPQLVAKVIIVTATVLTALNVAFNASLEARHLGTMHQAISLSG
jgi:hypothetical protein